jgi:hypothetical protein
VRSRNRRPGRARSGPGRPEQCQLRARAGQGSTPRLQSAPAPFPPRLSRRLPLRSAKSVLPASLLPRLTSLRFGSITTPRFPQRPCPCLIDTCTRAISLLRPLRLEPALASLQQTHPCPRPTRPPPSRPLLLCPICRIFRWAHGRSCSRRTKSRRRALTLLRGDCRCRLSRSAAHITRPPPKAEAAHPGPLLAAISISRRGPVWPRQSGPFPGRPLQARASLIGWLRGG